jgi:hypothetical protein
MAEDGDNYREEHRSTNINVHGDANFMGSFVENERALQRDTEKESLFRYYLKNPAKIRDWLIIIYVLYSIAKGESLGELAKSLIGK